MPSRRSPTEILPPSHLDPEANPIRWERAPVLTPRRAVVTGDAASDAVREARTTYLEALRALRSRPLLVYVHEDPDSCDGSCRGACDRYFDVEQQVFGSARVLIAARAFRPVWMLPAEAEAEGLLEPAGPVVVPSLVLVDPVRRTAERLHGGSLRASRTYDAMRQSAARFYGVDLDDVMDRHEELSKERDRVDREAERLEDRIGHASSPAKRSRLEEELDLVRAEQRALAHKVELLWALEPRAD